MLHRSGSRRGAFDIFLKYQCITKDRTYAVVNGAVYLKTRAVPTDTHPIKKELVSHTLDQGSDVQ
jgi:hypothetical protein